MKLLTTILFLISGLTCFCQNKCSAIIDWKYVEPVIIYEKPKGKINHTMKNDSTNEDFLNLEIFDQNESYFYVSIRMSTKKDSAIGWIKKANYIGAYKRNEKFPMDLTLYKNKNVSDTDEIIITNWIPTLLTIEKYEDKWVFVSLKQNGQIYKGWIQTNELCANSYTYCN